MAKGFGVDEIKKLITTFQNEYYPMRKGGSSSTGKPIHLLFYERARAMEALDVIRNSAPPFAVELITHLKEIGTNQNPLEKEEEKHHSSDSDSDGTSQKKVAPPKDDDGFTMIR